MLTINNLQLSIPNMPIGNNIHPFYRDSVRQLFGIEIADGQHHSPTRNRTTLTAILRDALGIHTHNLIYFFDIRLQEELGSPSPQYELLADLGLKTVLPVCIHGPDLSIVQEGLSMVDTLLSNGQQALCAVSLLSSAEWQSCGHEFVIAFLASSDGISDNKIFMKGTMINGK
jgi:hypothetical protein